jgi:hypothetical protein
MIDLEALAVARAEQQLGEGAWRDDVDDRWVMHRRERCECCNKGLHPSESTQGPVCAKCKRARKRQKCWACDERAEVRGYCRNHWDQVRQAGVVDSLHINPAREGKGAPQGWGSMVRLARGRAA